MNPGTVLTSGKRKEREYGVVLGSLLKRAATQAQKNHAEKRGG
jgi:hypothetical protein